MTPITPHEILHAAQFRPGSVAVGAVVVNRKATMPTPKPQPIDAVICPFTVLIDGREKAPYRFDGIRADAGQQHRPIVVSTQWQHLVTGDYTISGLEDKVCVERKSLADLYSTLGQHRDRFEREHERMLAIVEGGGSAVVVVEADWETAMHLPPARSQLPPKVVFRTAVSWQVRYRVPWLFMPDRRFAEIYTFRFLEKFWKFHNSKERSDGKAISSNSGD
jgi:DNA excision repair protein ERCC-4